MRLATLLPRPLSPGTGAESPSILNCLIASVYLERKRARTLGWRGVYPSDARYPAWTCRVAGSPHVYGLVFQQERTDKAFLYGTFAAYIFPRTEDPILETFPLQALALAMEENYETAVRNLSLHAEDLAPFHMGKFNLTTALDGSGLSVSLCAPARCRSRSEDGIAAQWGAASGRTVALSAHDQEWVVPPGGVAYDVPAFRLLLRAFSVLAATAATLFAEEPRLSLHVAPQGENDGLPVMPGPDARWLSIKAALGTEPEPMSCAAVSRNATFAALTAGGKVLSRLPARHTVLDADKGAMPVIHILTGFLGAGKTTFLRRWLDYLNGREQFASVIQNEFGKIGLDALLVRGESHVEALDEGCVCCSLADSLRPGLQRLLAAAPADRIILETTGLANPANVLSSIKELGDMVRPGLVITVADVSAREKNGIGVSTAQVEQADVIIANKVDAVSKERLEAVIANLRHCNPRAVILPAVQGNIAFARLDALYLEWMDKSGKPPSQGSHIRPMEHGRYPDHTEEGFTSFCLPVPQTVNTQDIRHMLRLVGPGLCRAKGIVNLAEGGSVAPVVVQYAAGRLEFEDMPEETPERYMVFIGVNLERSTVESRRFPVSTWAELSASICKRARRSCI